MAGTKQSILVVEDEQAMCDLLTSFFRERSYEVDAVGSGEDAVERFSVRDYALVITDIKLPGISGLELLAKIKPDSREVAVIVTTAYGSISSAVESMKLGADDYLVKPVRLDELALAVEKALEQRSLRREVKVLRAEVSNKYSFSNIVGRSKPMRQLFDTILRVAARRDIAALIIGSTGTGKELVSRAIHHNSERRAAPFQPINCSAIPATLLESELFGYEKGAFTGATGMRRGLIEQAQGGTVFLDEINTLDQNLQAKILRVLQERALRRLGGSAEIPIDVRFVSASNQDLEEAVRKGEFRSDLFYRLNVVSIRLPDLKDRPEDIPLLVDHFLQNAAKDGEPVRRFSSEAMRILMKHSWPGNVRELENAVEHAWTMGLDEVLTPEDLPGGVTGTGQDLVEAVRTGLPPLRELEKRYILGVMDKVDGRRITASRLLGIDRRTLSRRLEEYGYNGGRNSDWAENDSDDGE